MTSIERDVTNNNDFERVHNESFPFYDYKTEIIPVNVLNGPKNPVIVSGKERGTLKVVNVTGTPSGTGTFDITLPTYPNKKYTIKAIETYGNSFVGTVATTYYQFLGMSLYSFSGYASKQTFGEQNITIKNGDVVRARFSISAYTSGGFGVNFLVQEFEEAY